jgi:hypothetical protein
MMDCPHCGVTMECVGMSDVGAYSRKTYQCNQCLTTVQGPLACHVCGGSGELMHMVERGGGPPGNWVGPCPKGCEITAV